MHSLVGPYGQPAYFAFLNLGRRFRQYLPSKAVMWPPGDRGGGFGITHRTPELRSIHFFAKLSAAR